MNYLLKMAQRIDTLNELMIKGWRNEGLNFRRALRLEAAEAMESTPWKWWKSGEMDRSNLIVEGVDMMHFGLSICLLDGYEGWNWLDEEVSRLMESKMQVPDDSIVETVQNTIDNIMEMTFDKSISLTGPSDLIYEITKLMWFLGVSRDEMFKLYFAKNILNEFRQLNGYKSGEYIKDWDGSEDNVFMQNSIDDIAISSHFEDDLYKLLEDKYEAVKASKKEE